MNRVPMKHIKTLSERCEEHPDHQQGMVSEKMIRARMQEIIDELRQALETEQEPVALPCCGYTNIDENWTPVYTAPPKREWVGLTAPEVQECYDLNPARFASRIEAKLKEKNT